MIPDARRDGPAALDRLEALGHAAGWPTPAVLELRLVAEEVLTNVAKYGYEPGATPEAELLLTLTEESAVLEFRDLGKPFDPLDQPPPDLDLPPEDRAIGGLGLTLVRALVEEARYVREGPANVLRLVKKRPAQ